MNLVHCLETIATARGEGPVDWGAAQTAAKAITTPGSLALTGEEQTAYRTDIRDARDSIRTSTGIEFDLPTTIEIQNRHHWIDANIPTISRILEPLNSKPLLFSTVTRRINTATFTTMLAFLANHVLGQYDPVLLAKTDAHSLYFVHPNIVRTADTLDVEYERFRRWIVFHEVTHAAEFSVAPWLVQHLESELRTAIDKLAEGNIDRGALATLDTTMTVVEGYAEFTMDHAFDDEYADLREKIDKYRRSRGPITRLLRRALGLGVKQRQYERGRSFFEAVTDAQGLEIAPRVWDDPESLPTETELDYPGQWIARITA